MLIEALASGVPVAAYPVVGPIDIITEPATGTLDADLGHAIERALATGDADACVRHARPFTWERFSNNLVNNIVVTRVKA